MNWQLFTALGIFFGFSANLIFYWSGDLAWRFQIASALIPAVMLLCFVWHCPESPRWLLKKGEGKKAFASLCALRRTPLQAAIELFFANAQIQKEIEYTRKKKSDNEMQPMTGAANGKNGETAAHVELVEVQELGKFDRYKQEVAKSTYWSRIIQLFFNPRTRRATIAASIVMLGQQLCGV